MGYTLSLEWSWRSASGRRISLRRREFVTLSHSAHWIVWETQNDGNVMALGDLDRTEAYDLAAAAIFGVGVQWRETSDGTSRGHGYNILGQ